MFKKSSLGIMSAFSVLKGGTSRFSTVLKFWAYVFSSSLFFSPRFKKPWFGVYFAARQWIIAWAGTGELEVFLAC